jgi:hypothetical protein
LNDLGKKLLLAATAVIFSLIVAEVLLRLFGGAPPRGNITPVPASIAIRSNHPSLPYRLRPGARVVHRFPDNPRGYFDPDATLTYSINSLGFRGRETSRGKPAGVFRIVGVGDSFTFGTGVRVEDTFLGDLERRLAATESSSRFEVLNLGVMMFDTVNEVALLREVGVRLEPDIVVICFFLNDTDGGPTHSLFNVDSSREGVAGLGRYSLLLDRILWGLERRRQIMEVQRAYHRSFESGAQGWVNAQWALESAAELAKREKFQLVLMIFPVLWNLSDSYPFVEIHETVASFARSRGIATLDLLQAFSGHQGPELWVHPTNQHPNEIAHAIAGRALFDFLLSRELLPQKAVIEASAAVGAAP